MKNKSFQEKISKRRNSFFIGRENEIDFFQRNLALDSDDLEHKNIIYISGIGGVGKTTLLQKFIFLSKEDGNIYTYLDEDIKSVEDFLFRIVYQFQEQGLQMSSKFETIYREIGEIKKQAILTTEETNKDALTSKDVVKKSVIIEDETIKVASKIHQLKTTLSEEFTEQLFNIDEKRKICFFIDSFEATKYIIGDWLRNFLSQKYGEIPANILITIASRNSINEDNLNLVPSLTQEIHLSSFSEKEATELLKQKGINDINQIKSLFKFSNGIPVLLALMSEKSHEYIEKSVFDEIKKRVKRDELDAAINSLQRLVKSKNLKKEEDELGLLIQQMKYLRNEIAHNRIELNFAEKENAKIINSILSFVERIEKYNF